ncbi:MAG: hypothetical protein Q9166_002577 [cf. Caloplaca sp. 2 TL-2023]
MILLFTFAVLNTLALFVPSVLLLRNIYSLATNTTTIEKWEIERHETLVRRARTHGGYLDGPDGVRFRITKQEFPYDIGIYQNIRQTMGTGFFLWLWPLASTPGNERGLEFETNGFEDPGKPWPPIDPDRLPRRQYRLDGHESFTYEAQPSEIDVQAFKDRQRKDALRYSNTTDSVSRRMPYQRPSNDDEGYDAAIGNAGDDDHHRRAGLGWRDSEGDRLQDLGVDEEAEYFDEDDLPLAELLRRKKLAQQRSTMMISKPVLQQETMD